ncbi:mannose-6-phosphate isomerase, class I [Longirhabdus pacifica]|uniref:mannose-6-phosphate isomerase, class I n=1 Tax=Longirhabdus pacifica TaxID=2305227 RepID=UPI0010089E3A|nr:mannose-6-phosphate isomerase, class I [Longirhabdus pacifica]
MKAYPLKFKPEMKERIWGGRALEQFGFDMPDGNIGEAWVISDHANGTSKVINGELAGLGLDEVREKVGPSFFGKRGFSEKTGRFPLLVKLLDCQDDLSVQVHPTDEYEHLAEQELGKTEMWYVISAKPGASIIYGLKENTTKEDFKKAIEENHIMSHLREVPVKAGDTFYIPAGTVHALKAGVVVAEIQQNSDTTYRIYDYNRPGLDGKMRELHIEDSIHVTNVTNDGAFQKETALAAEKQWLTLCASPYFIVEKGKLEHSWSLQSEEDSFVIHIVCEGAGTLEWEEESLSLKEGDAILIPANLGNYTLTGSMTVLRSYVPKS